MSLDLTSKLKEIEVNKIYFYSIIFITFLISVIAYHAFFSNGWYVQDDYISIEKGGAGSISENAIGTINWLYAGQGRFQPVRLFIFSAATQMFQEEYAPIYNFALHLVNLLLFFYLLRKFNVSNIHSLIIVLLFSLFGRYRMMESPAVMIAGSGLNLFFILVTLIFLIKAIKENYWGVKKISWYAISLTSYAGLTFSYEVAFPLILVVIYTFVIFNDERSKQWDIKRYLPLAGYFSLLSIYLIFFRQTESSYEGASIVWNYDIFTRFKSYLKYALDYPTKLRAIPELILFFILYYFATYLAIKADSATTNKEQEDNPLILAKYKLFGFGVIFYFSAVVLLTLNHWQTPTSIMRHHVYLITAGSSIFIISMVLGLQYFVRPSIRKFYFHFMIWFIFPIVLAGGFCKIIKTYEGQKERTDAIKLIKYKLQSSIDDPSKLDAILIKNFANDGFAQGYYGISGVDGAYLQWFGFKKYIHSGREIISVLDNNIKFKGPLTYYNLPNVERDVDNENVEIFYLNEADKNLLTYSDNINFLEGKNLHQIDQVMGDSDQRKCNENHVLNVLLKNLQRRNTLAISLDSVDSIAGFLKEARIEINGRAAKTAFVKDKVIYIDGVPDAKYIFLRIVSTNYKFKKSLEEIKFDNNPPGDNLTRIQLNDTTPESLKSGSVLLPTWEWGNGFYSLEGSATNYWRWASQSGILSISNDTKKPLRITLEMILETSHNELHQLEIRGEFWNDKLSINSSPFSYVKELVVPPGQHAVSFESSSPDPDTPDPRILSYNIQNFRVGNCQVN
jgi:hypothetical protein